jgi:hypothetical protein
MKFSTLVIFLAALFFGLVMVVAESGKLVAKREQ